MASDTYEEACLTAVARGWWTMEDLAKFYGGIAAVSGERTAKDVEESFNEVLDDLGKDRLGKGAADQLKGAAESSIKRQTGSEALGRAIRSR